ncbi:hypothetical protein [Aureimonas glaciei]|uniref:Uncharacterized protein n=1 Tax=Aureimonas glaciei TaxID=1776957 RepID=A0A916Y522_9HYPH|nr:hypothetical protein [Aureimonas glaciei]GGD30075.1 hypothetical protein GCM10011335_36440 [Aureimonas glaciei]
MSGAVLRIVKAVTAAFGSGYRPEEHYMRGPGPAFRKRFGSEAKVSR